MPEEDPLTVIEERRAAFEAMLPTDIPTAEAKALQGQGTGNPIVWLGYRPGGGQRLLRVMLPVADNTFTWLQLTENDTGQTGYGNLPDGPGVLLIKCLRALEP